MDMSTEIQIFMVNVKPCVRDATLITISSAVCFVSCSNTCASNNNWTGNNSHHHFCHKWTHNSSRQLPSREASCHSGIANSCHDDCCCHNGNTYVIHNNCRTNQPHCGGRKRWRWANVVCAHGTCTSGSTLHTDPKQYVLFCCCVFW